MERRGTLGEGKEEKKNKKREGHGRNAAKGGRQEMEEVG